VADWHTPAGWVYPVYFCAGDGAAAVLILARRRVTAAAGMLARPVAGPLPPAPDDGPRWYERPEWHAVTGASFLLPDLARIAGRAWMLDTLRWTQEQASSVCLAHRRAGCRACTRVRPQEPAGP
jgi:hypothetical protein